MKRAYYSATISKFLESSEEQIIGELAISSEFADLQTQKSAWLSQIEICKQVLSSYSGHIYFEFSIPRMGQRIDVVVIIQSVASAVCGIYGYKLLWRTPSTDKKAETEEKKG